jgi:homoserine kinase
VTGYVGLRAEPVTVRPPATSANLGPGFDAFGLALELRDEVTVRVLDAGLELSVEGEGADSVPRDENHLIVRSLHAAFARMGVRPPGLSVRCRNRIPHGRGLGSSSAAICAGLMAARALVPDGELLLDAYGVLDLATELEGHPDNVAPCLVGGFTTAWHDKEGVDVLRLDPVEELSATVFVPGQPLATEVARSLLPDAVPHADAAFNAGRAGLLSLALTAPGLSAERRRELLYAGTEDRLHQEQRAPAMPASAELIARLRADGHPAFVSGAGPSVLAFGVAGAPELKSSEYARSGNPAGGNPANPAQGGQDWRASVLAVATAGVVVDGERASRSS